MNTIHLYSLSSSQSAPNPLKCTGLLILSLVISHAITIFFFSLTCLPYLQEWLFSFGSSQWRVSNFLWLVHKLFFLLLFPSLQMVVTWSTVSKMKVLIFLHVCEFDSVIFLLAISSSHDLSLCSATFSMICWFLNFSCCVSQSTDRQSTMTESSITREKANWILMIHWGRKKKQENCFSSDKEFRAVQMVALQWLSNIVLKEHSFAINISSSKLQLLKKQKLYRLRVKL